jgi:ML domain
VRAPPVFPAFPLPPFSSPRIAPGVDAAPFSAPRPSLRSAFSSKPGLGSTITACSTWVNAGGQENVTEMKRTLSLLGLGLAALHAVPLTSCGGEVSWSALSVSPATPKAGSPVELSANGTAKASITGGSGLVSAFLFGADVFDGQIFSCGANQTIDVEGIVQITFNGLACPLATGDPASLSLSLVIPEVAAGIGEVGVIINSTDSRGSVAFCLNMSVVF